MIQYSPLIPSRPRTGPTYGQCVTLFLCRIGTADQINDYFRDMYKDELLQEEDFVHDGQDGK